MLSSLARRIQPAVRSLQPCREQHGRSLTKHDPLRILFCGADDFSIFSLRALKDLQINRPEKIASIDVVCKPDKRVGRGLKQIQQVPIKSAAIDLGLRLHQIDTFTGWTPPNPVNLIVAVSFGLLVPPRTLGSAKYGGLNVHPSMLPDLRGPAPIHHTLLAGRTHTGVTLQTLHPKHFDQGVIMAQTPGKGVEVPFLSTPDSLLHLLGPLGAQLLREGIETGLFVPPPDPIPLNRSWQKPGLEDIQHAPKITPEDRHIDWSTWPHDKILRHDRVLGRLWDSYTYQRIMTLNNSDAAVEPKRITYHGPWEAVSLVFLDQGLIDQGELSEDPRYVKHWPQPGRPLLFARDGKRDIAVGFRTCDGFGVFPAAATIEGQRKGKGFGAMSMELLKGQEE